MDILYWIGLNPLVWVVVVGVLLWRWRGRHNAARERPWMDRPIKRPVRDERRGDDGWMDR